LVEAQTASSAAAPEASAAPPVQPAAGPEALALGGGSGGVEYVIGPEDTIEVGIVGQPDKARVRVYTDGTFQMNLIGKVTAAGKTPRQLASEIAQSLKTGGYYANPMIDVEVVGYASRYVTVLGAVGSPSLVPINRAYHLSEILARVGGVREGAADYLIVRSEAGSEKRYQIDKLSAGAPADDPAVAAGDKIFVPTAEVFYISGQVKAPGSYPVKTDMTIGQAIAKAGGLTESGSDKKIKVSRGGAKVVKLGPTEKIQPGDVLTVTERLF
jgi:polysaccharide export outer membrane protein